MPSGKGQPSPAPSKRLNVSRTVEAAMPSRRAISRVEIPAENFKRMISRTWRIATLSAGIIAPLDCQRRDPKQASGGARRHSRPRAALFRSGGRHHLVMMGGLNRNQRPKGLHRIRHYGLFAKNACADNIARARELLAVSNSQS